jgi:[ribosomal protein S18]-alanine N-acetyltransferase
MLSRYTVRRFRLADMDRVLEIELASFGKDAYDRKLFAEYGRKCGDLFLLASLGPRVDGYSIACIYKNRGVLTASLESIAVDPPARGKGAASSLLKSTIRRLKLRDVGRFTLMVRRSNMVAQRFYQRHQFTPVRRAPGYYEDGEEGLLMRRLLMRKPLAL